MLYTQLIYGTMIITAVGLGTSVFFIIGINTIEAWFWAYIYLLLGEFQTINDALYFSISTATTVGYGDVVMSEQWRLLSSFEAMGWWLLFGPSTVFFNGINALCL